MYTGIIQELGQICEVTRTTPLRYGVKCPPGFLHQATPGCSISVDGVCQTALVILDDIVYFDAIDETLLKTTLDALIPQQHVNLERSLKYGDEIGGHVLSGHVLGKIQLKKIEQNIFTFELPEPLQPYLFSKGFVALDGVSLTVGEVNQASFCCHLIPETLKRTTFGFKTPGAFFNIEIDMQTKIVVDTLKRILSSQEK